jgi:hypothetical protein
MPEQTTVCDCGMPVAIQSSWVGRYVRCPHCSREFVVQQNLTLLPPGEAHLGTAPPPPVGPGVPPPMVGPGARPPESLPVARQPDTGEDLDITLTGARPLPARSGPPIEVTVPSSPFPQIDQPPPTQQPAADSTAAPPAAAWPRAGEQQSPTAQQPADAPPGQRLVVELAPNVWVERAVFIVGLASLPLVLLAGIGSLIAGATAIVLGWDQRRPDGGRAGIVWVGVFAGVCGLLLSVVYWLVVGPKLPGM